MKKFIAVLLAMLLVLVNVAALAGSIPEVPDTRNIPNPAKGETNTDPVIKKTYTTTGTVTDVYPTETLEFTVTSKEDSYPEVTVGYDGTEAGKAKNTFKVEGAASYDIPVNVPSADEYGEAGLYHYTVAEKVPTNPSQGVTYDTTEYNVDVYVFYKIVDGKVTNELDQYIAIYTGEVQTTGTIATKGDEIENKYEVGELTVTKEIAGNLADPDKEFTIVVTLTSTNTVASPLTVSSTGSYEGATAMGANKYVFTATLTGGQNIVIGQIPSGMTYNVEEVGITAIEATAQLENANNSNAYTVDYGSQTGAIGSSSLAATVTNTKEIDIPTGISVEFVPYLVIIALAGITLVALRLRRREEA